MLVKVSLQIIGVDNRNAVGEYTSMVSLILFCLAS